MEFSFIADHPVLDFVATVAERGTTSLEALVTPADLGAWVTRSGVVDGEPVVTPGGLERARALREALFALVAAAIDGGAVRAHDRDLVNAAAARPRPVLHLAGDGRVERRGDLDAVLAALATDGLDLLAGPDRALLSWCADPRCTRPFVDRSRGRRRRWCDMRGCGERAKSAAYRRRQHAAASGA